jgi:hypothetical protein
MTAENMELMISVIKIRTVYCLRTLKNLVCLQVLLLAPLLSTLYMHVTCQDLCLQMLCGDWDFG